MAKDDYFVIAFKVLNMLYKWLKNGERPDANKLTAEYFAIEDSYWEYIISNLNNDGYISGIKTYLRGFRLNNIAITPNGIEYLQENNMMKKAADVVRDALGIVAEHLPWSL